MPTPYPAPPTAPHGAYPDAPSPAGDATADFQKALNDPTRWIIKRSVPLFKQHERKDPNTGNMIRVDLPKLYRIAANMQRMERQDGVPVRVTLGHTEPGKPEVQQPPVGGYYRNARVQPFGPKGEPAIVADEWLDPQYSQSRKNFPYRSAEYYDDAEQITGVALLTRDPFLDLGVVAYSREDSLVCYTCESPSAVHYARGDRRPVMYQLVLGEVPMYPPQPAPVPNTAVPPGYAPPVAYYQPIAAVPPGCGQPTHYAAPTGYAPPPAPVPYGYAAPYQGAWPGPPHRRAAIGHQHPSGGAVYAQYATEPPEDDGPPPGGGGPGGPPPGGPGGGGDVLGEVYTLLSQAVAVLGQAVGGGAGGGAAPTSPFPGAGGPTMAGRYGAAPARRPVYRQAPARRYARAETPPPAPPAPPPRTISGLPVGYQMELDRLRSQLKTQEKALQVVFYERDQADTAWCVSEVRRLAGEGFPVGEYEVGELKKKAPAEREAYLEHISTKYGRIGTDQLPPPMMGDPTPAPAPDGNRPATREEMDAALSLTGNDRSPGAFTQALNYIRGGGQPPVAYGPPNRLADAAAAHAWEPGAPAPEANGASW